MGRGVPDLAVFSNLSPCSIAKVKYAVYLVDFLALLWLYVQIKESIMFSFPFEIKISNWLTIDL